MDVRLKLLAPFLLFLTACATTPAQRSELRAFIDEQLATPPYDHAVWGVHIEEDDGSVLYSRNARTLMIPASNRKVFAAATIANCLGLGTQLETRFYLDGDDLVVRGDGDPSLGSWRYDRDGDFDRVAGQLRERGITRIRDVVADVSAFDRVTIPGGWKHGNLGSDYSAAVDALSWNESEIPVDRAVPDPPLHAANALRNALVLAGIDVTGTTRVETEARPRGEPVATLPSPLIVHLLTTVLKNSHNLYTEMLFKRSTDGTYPSSFAAERAFAEMEARVPSSEFRFVDGSGLAPDDLVSPIAMITMLRWMNDPLRRGTWWQLLAQPANEGTLRRRLVTLESSMRGKTGTINGVNALSGIIALPNGRHRYFSVIVNHHLGDDVTAVIDRIVERVAR